MLWKYLIGSSTNKFGLMLDTVYRRVTGLTLEMNAEMSLRRVFPSCKCVFFEGFVPF